MTKAQNAYRYDGVGFSLAGRSNRAKAVSYVSRLVSWRVLSGFVIPSEPPFPDGYQGKYDIKHAKTAEKPNRPKRADPVDDK